MRLDEFIHSPAITCDLKTTLSEAAHLMHLRDVGSVVVLDADGGIAGIVTDRDLALKGYARDLPASATVGEVMTRSAHTIAADADTRDAIAQMTYHGVRRLPVIGEHGELRGVVTFDDMVIFVEQEAESLRHALEGQIRADAPSWSRGWDT
jgi:CBS domain-containing protein